MSKKDPTTDVQENVTLPEENPGDLAPMETQFRIISLDLIDDPERPMRTDMTPASVEDLVLSIKQVGIIEPIVVKMVNGRYEVIAGHRRKYSSELAGLAEVPCSVLTVNDEQTEMLKIHENLYRAEVKPSDEAQHFKYLIDKHHMTPTKVSQLIGKSLSYVSDRLAIFNYPDFLKDAMDKKQISFSVAREFARMDDLQEMSNFVFYAIRNGITQDAAQKWVQDHRRAKENPVIQETQTYNEETQLQEVTHSAECVYCKEGVALLEASVVYMHDACLRQANTN